MRQIKFRAWDKVNKEWVNNPKVSFWYKTHNDTQLSYLEVRHENCLLVKKFELMQYTGLKDGNDVRVYEGDIIETKYYDKTKRIVIEMKQIDFFGGEEGCIGFGLCLEYPFTHIKEDKDGNYGIKVIGNIYENPELIKDNK